MFLNVLLFLVSPLYALEYKTMFTSLNPENVFLQKNTM